MNQIGNFESFKLFSINLIYLNSMIEYELKSIIIIQILWITKEDKKLNICLCAFIWNSFKNNKFWWTIGKQPKSSFGISIIRYKKQTNNSLKTITLPEEEMLEL